MKKKNDFFVILPVATPEIQLSLSRLRQRSNKNKNDQNERLKRHTCLALTSPLFLSLSPGLSSSLPLSRSPIPVCVFFFVFQLVSKGAPSQFEKRGSRQQKYNRN